MVFGTRTNERRSTKGIWNAKKWVRHDKKNMNRI